MPEAANEHRQHPRFDLACPIYLHNEAGQLVANTRTVNVSDGGILVPIPHDSALPEGSVLLVRLNVPASATCKGDAREISCRAKILRYQDTDDSSSILSAMAFLQPIQLDLAT